MKYIVIGLGVYGRTVAQDLAALGHDVIAVDSDASLVDHIKDRVATTFVLDSTDEEQLALLPLKDIDTVIVAIGENFGASIRTIALLKKKGVRHLYARAMDEIQKSILEAFELDKILSPEEESARNLVREMDFGGSVNVYPVDKDHFVFTIQVPSVLVGRQFRVLNLYEKYQLKPITLRRVEEHRNMLGIRIREARVVEVSDSMMLAAGDEIVCYGTYENYQKFCKEQK